MAGEKPKPRVQTTPTTCDECLRESPRIRGGGRCCDECRSKWTALLKTATPEAKEAWAALATKALPGTARATLSVVRPVKIVEGDSGERVLYALAPRSRIHWLRQRYSDGYFPRLLGVDGVYFHSVAAPTPAVLR